SKACPIARATPGSPIGRAPASASRGGEGWGSGSYRCLDSHSNGSKKSGRHGVANREIPAESIQPGWVTHRVSGAPLRDRTLLERTIDRGELRIQVRSET